MQLAPFALLFAVTAVATAAGTPPRPTGNVVTVDISNLQFNPANIEVHVGDVVQWSNTDFIDHTATANGGLWDVTIPSGGKQRMIAPRQGTFGYICRTHPNMQGTITVVP